MTLPKKDAFRFTYCTTCGTLLGVEAGGGSVYTDPGFEEENQERYKLHRQWHKDNDRRAGLWRRLRLAIR